MMTKKDLNYNPRQNILEHNRNLQILQFRPPSTNLNVEIRQIFEKKSFKTNTEFRGREEGVWEKKFMKFLRLFHLFCPRL